MDRLLHRLERSRHMKDFYLKGGVLVANLVDSPSCSPAKTCTFLDENSSRPVCMCADPAIGPRSCSHPRGFVAPCIGHTAQNDLLQPWRFLLPPGHRPTRQVSLSRALRRPRSVFGHRTPAAGDRCCGSRRRLGSKAQGNADLQAPVDELAEPMVVAVLLSRSRSTSSWLPKSR